MNQSQKQYARSRVDKIEQEKLQMIPRTNFETQKLRFDPEKRLKLFKAGKFKVDSKNGNPFTSYEDFRNVIICEGERKFSLNEKAYKAAQDKVRKQANKIRDEIMLGDPEKALQLIQKFENEGN